MQPATEERIRRWQLPGSAPTLHHSRLCSVIYLGIDSCFRVTFGFWHLRLWALADIFKQSVANQQGFLVQNHLPVCVPQKDLEEAMRNKGRDKVRKKGRKKVKSDSEMCLFFPFKPLYRNLAPIVGQRPLSTVRCVYAAPIKEPFISTKQIINTFHWRCGGGGLALEKKAGQKWTFFFYKHF